MKKKQVVALLLTAAMTTASFLPSTGFFNVMETQAAELDTIDAEGFAFGTISLDGLGFVSAGAIVSTAAIKESIRGDGNTEVKVVSGDNVEVRAIISGAGITAETAIASLGGLGLTADPEEISGGSIGLSSVNVESGGVVDFTSAASLRASFRPIGFGSSEVKFTSGADVVSNLPKFKLKVMVKSSEVTVGSIKAFGESASAFDSPKKITSQASLAVTSEDALKLKSTGMVVPAEYVSGDSLHFQWYRNVSTSAGITDGGWEPYAGVDKDDVKPTSSGAYKLVAWVGPKTNSSGAVQYGPWYVDAEETKTTATIQATCVTPGTLSYADYKFTVANAALWNEAEGKEATETNSLVYSWYTVEKDVVDSLPKNGVNSVSAGVIVNNKAAFITSGSANTLNINNYESYFKNKEAYVAVVISAKDNAESIKKAFHIHQDKVGYTESTGNNNGRSNSSRSSGSSGSSGTSTGTNSSNGSNTANNNTSNTGTTNNASTTTTPTTTPTSNTVTNADGSKTTTTSETKADGTKVETTKTEYPDGSTLEVTKETKPDGTTIETTVETAANGDKATTVYTVSPNGTKSKKVSIVKADGTSETSTITENKDGSATIVNETKDASGTTSMAYSLPAGAAGVTLDKIETTAKKVVIPAKIAIAGGAATLKGVTSLKANTLTLEGKTIKVTKVGAAALKGNKTATNLVVGKNIKTIGKQAFMNASKVKTVNIKGNVNTVGKNSFKNINKKATIKIKTTAKQFKALKKKIKNKGAAPAKVTYKRVK